MERTCGEAGMTSICRPQKAQHGCRRVAIGRTTADLMATAATVSRSSVASTGMAAA